MVEKQGQQTENKYIDPPKLLPPNTLLIFDKIK
jgi:hypothetical protein